MIKKSRIDINEYKNRRKTRNKIVQILANLKSQNLFKSRSRNLLKSRNLVKVQNASIKEEFNFLNSNTRISFIKL